MRDTNPDKIFRLPICCAFLENAITKGYVIKVRQFRNDFWCLRFLPKNEQKQVVIVVRRIRLFVFWKNSKTPKIISKLTDLKFSFYLRPTKLLISDNFLFTFS